MEKKTKGSLIIIVLIIVCIIVFLAYTYSKKDEPQNQTNNNIVIQNTTKNNNITVNNVVEDKEITTEENPQKIEEEESEQDNTKQVEEVSTNKPEVSNKTSEVTYANDEEKAIEIAKKAWGDTSGVYFAKENINSNGEYIISVSANAAVLARYTVNVTTGTCTVQYN